MHLNCLKLHTLLVPAGMTWLLQPLDTHVFNSLKRTLHDRQTRGRAMSPLGILPANSWIRIAGEAIQDVLVNRDWTHSLRGNGLHSKVVPLRATLLRFFEEVVPLLAEPLTSEQMKDLLNRPTMDRRDVCMRHSMRLLEERAGVPAARVVPIVLRRLMGLPGRIAAVVAEAVPAMPAASGASGSAGPTLPAPALAVRHTRSGGLY